MLLKDKVCIVTGGGVQIGRAFAEQLLKEGAFVKKFFSHPFLKKHFFSSSELESEKFINCLLFSLFIRIRFPFSTWTVIQGNCVVLNCSNNLAKIV